MVTEPTKVRHKRVGVGGLERIDQLGKCSRRKTIKKKEEEEKPIGLGD